MDTEFWEAVRERANTLWLEEGCPEGKSDQHWQQAEHDVLASVQAVPVAVDQPEEEGPVQARAYAVEELEAPSAPDVETCTDSAPADPAPSVPRPQVKGMSLFKLRARQCRFVVSETCSPAIFCAAPTDGGSWCQEHRARVFVRSSPRPVAKVERQISAW
jgi:hypothetical protein